MPIRSMHPFAAALLIASVLTGCADSEPSEGAQEDSQTSSAVDEVTVHNGLVCPERLPTSGGDDRGFGTYDPAESAPSLPTPESAWVCQYGPREAGPAPDGNGTTLRWVKVGKTRPVDAARLPTLEHALEELTPPEMAGGQVCTADLGPRWMLVFSNGRDLTGIVVDDYGCRDVRLTDEPFETAPGEAIQPGIVPGVLTGATDLLAEIKAGRGD